MRLRNMVAKVCCNEAQHSEIDIFEKQIYPLINEFILNNNWKGVLLQACKIGNMKYINMALNNNAKIDPAIVGASIISNDINIFKFICEKYCVNLHGSSDHDKLAFWQACEKYKCKQVFNECLNEASAIGNLDICSYLMNNGAEERNGPLYEACKHGHLKLAKYLIDHGADGKPFQNPYSDTSGKYDDALYEACKGKHYDIINMLVKHGADNWLEVIYMAYHDGEINDNIKVEIIQYAMCYVNSSDIDVNYFRDNQVVFNEIIKHDISTFAIC